MTTAERQLAMDAEEVRNTVVFFLSDNSTDPGMALEAFVLG